ncbi:hypothetical protein C8039_03785 [Halogeometricum sp. wsp3]|nr:hypothetical protein C8039_03785 [Halogeometricum sp. wsp3]
MADPDSTSPTEDERGNTPADAVAAETEPGEPGATGDALRRPVLASRAMTASRARHDTEALRKQVETDDFDNFGPSDMVELAAEEWDVAFDENPGSPPTNSSTELRGTCETAWRTVMCSLASSRRQDQPRVLVYSDEGYALVTPDGDLQGEGTVYRDVRPTLVLCSMDDFEVAEPPEDSPPAGRGPRGRWRTRKLDVTGDCRGTVPCWGCPARGCSTGDAGRPV